jgi:hypothetical protein
VDAFAHLVGKESDTAVAEKAGVTAESIRLYRKKHNIPSLFETRSAAARAEAPAAAEPKRGPGRPRKTAPAAEAGEPAIAFKVLAAKGSEEGRFVLFASDVADAVAKATAGLAARADGPWKLRAVEEIAPRL